jgi:hypothetical protein
MVNPLVMDPWIWKNPGPLRVGDRVHMQFGREQVEGTIAEDRGNLGEGGKRIYGVRFRLDDVSDEMYMERVVDELTLVARAPEPSPEPRKKKRHRE